MWAVASTIELWEAKLHNGRMDNENDILQGPDAPADQDYIRLDQFLKLNNLVRSGGEAKYLIQDGNVKVNGQVETRRGKKLRTGDVVEMFGKKLRIEGDSTESTVS